MFGDPLVISKRAFLTILSAEIKDGFFELFQERASICSACEKKRETNLTLMSFNLRQDALKQL